MGYKLVSISNVNPDGVGQYVANYYGLIGPYKCPDTFSVAISPSKAIEYRLAGISFD